MKKNLFLYKCNFIPHVYLDDTAGAWGLVLFLFLEFKVEVFSGTLGTRDGAEDGALVTRHAGPVTVLHTVFPAGPRAPRVSSPRRDSGRPAAPALAPRPPFLPRPDGKASLRHHLRVPGRGRRRGRTLVCELWEGKRQKT